MNDAHMFASFDVTTSENTHQYQCIIVYSNNIGLDERKPLLLHAKFETTEGTEKTMHMHSPSQHFCYSFTGKYL